MHVSIEQIAEAALSLPSDARALLADRLVESLDPLTDPDVRDAWASEALQRLGDVRSGKVQAMPAQDVFARARALIKG
jgi:putative addiction module component (TIGR02574 family)